MAGNKNFPCGMQSDADRSKGSTGEEKGSREGCIGGKRTSGDAPELGAMGKDELDLGTRSPWLGWRKWRSWTRWIWCSGIGAGNEDDWLAFWSLQV